MNPTHKVCTAYENKMFCYTALVDANEGVIYSDQTGRFPVMSCVGMQYIFITYVYDQNFTIMHPMKIHTDESMVKVFEEVYQFLGEQNCKPKLHVFDNK